MSEELLLLITAGLDHDAADVDVAKAAVGLRTQFHRIAVTAHHAVGDTDVLAQLRRCGFQRDAVVIGVGHDIRHNHIMTAVQVERIVVVVVAVIHLDAADMQTVTGQIVLHPAAAVAQGDVSHGDILALYKSDKVRPRDALIVPRQLLERPSPSVDRSLSVDADILHLVGID